MERGRGEGHLLREQNLTMSSQNNIGPCLVHRAYACFLQRSPEQCTHQRTTLIDTALSQYMGKTLKNTEEGSTHKGVASIATTVGN